MWKGRLCARRRCVLGMQHVAACLDGCETQRIYFCVLPEVVRRERRNGTMSITRRVDTTLPRMFLCTLCLSVIAIAEEEDPN